MNEAVQPYVHSSAALEVGVARRDITPPVGIYARCWGAGKQEVAEGVHRPLSATVMVIRSLEDGDGGDRGEKTARAEARGSFGTEDRRSPPLVLAAVDATWWVRTEDEWLVRKGVLDHFGLDPARVMIATSHTHAGPSISAGDTDKPGGELVEGYLHQMRDALVSATAEALERAAPATLTWATGRCNMAANRDLPDPSRPRIICGFNPAIVADDTLLVGRVTDAGGRLLATIVNYACHATTLAWDNLLISPDFIGAMREVVEQHTGGVPCLFLQGASGELAPREQYTGDVAVADHNGRWLGFAALSTLESMLPPGMALRFKGVVESGAALADWRCEAYSPPTTLAAAMVQVDLPLKKWPPEEEIQQQLAACSDRTMAERLRRKLYVRHMVRPGPTCPMPAWIWRVGDSFIVGQPNEAYSLFQLALRKRFPEHAVAVMNVVNGTCGYLAPAELYDLDLYQIWQNPFDRQSLEVLTETCAREMARLCT